MKSKVEAPAQIAVKIYSKERILNILDILKQKRRKK